MMQATPEQRGNYSLAHHLLLSQPSFLPPVVKRLERRREPRSEQSFPARVWGVDIDHEAFGLDCIVDSISPSGLYLRMPWQIKAFSEISLVVHLLSGPNEGSTAAIKGRVIRDEPKEDGKRGIAVMITKYSFL
jgi:PilZ domain-containing protein